MGLKNFLEKIEPNFEKGGKYEKWYPLYEAAATILYTPGKVTAGVTHVKDSVDLKRIMMLVWMMTFPAMFWGMYNIGNQAALALMNDYQLADIWQVGLFTALGGDLTTAGWAGKMFYGAWFFIPVYAVTFIVGGFWEVLFATVRKHEVNEGFLVTSVLFALTLPPTIPLWQVALGTTFGADDGKEEFGGYGRNFLHPPLNGRAYLDHALPAQIADEPVSPADDGFSDATILSQAVTNTDYIGNKDLRWD